MRNSVLPLLFGCLLLNGHVNAQDRPSPDQTAANSRASLMVMLQYALQPAAPMLRDRATYDSRVAQRSAERVAFLASMLDETFDRDTSQTVSGTEASANIWKQRAEFTKLASELKAKAEAATATAKTGEEAQVKAALRGVTGACTACHDKFRSE